MFEGAYTALVTPFRRDGSVDYDKLRELVRFQIAAGIDGIVPVGTTGESPTLDMDEHIEVIRVVVEESARRVKVVAGTGANSTAEAIELTEKARELGADGTLQVTPYYNKPTQTGLVRHFSAVADLGLPVVLYNVPGRSSCEIAISTIAELSKHPKIVCVKEAGGSVDRVSRIKAVCDVEVLSGDDSLTLPMMSVGAGGVISVASNVAPQAVADLVHAAAAGRWDEARELHYRYYGVFTDVFLETNPIPIKAAMEMAGLGPAVYRLPLCEMGEANREKLRATLRRTGVIMSTPKKILLMGAAGRMGQALTRLLAGGSIPNLELVAAVDRSDSPLIGQDAGAAASTKALGVKISGDIAAALAQRPDVAIDFSFHAASAAAAPQLASAGVPWVVGTTGLDEADKAAIAKAAEKIPVVLAANMSLGVNLLFALVEQAARALKGRGYDCEIVERHHRRKKDAPSGTALFLGEAVAKGFGWSLRETAVDGRSGLVGERPEKEIGFHAVRGGDIVGDHTVLFAADGECVELSHRATSRDTLAIGALRAAAWLPGRPVGLYGMRDVIGLSPGAPS